MKFFYTFAFLAFTYCKSNQTKQAQPTCPEVKHSACAETIAEKPPECPAVNPMTCPENAQVIEKIIEIPGASPSLPAPTKPAKLFNSARLIVNNYERRAFRAHADEEHANYGHPKSIKRYKKKKYGKSIIEQRSGRKRLLDHNIFLRALFQGKLRSELFADLKTDFEQALIFDIGSAILFGEGADTVRDLFEDENLTGHLNFVASDINDPAQKKTMYVKNFRASGKKLPFPVVEIAMLMSTPEHFIAPLGENLKPGQAVILRSCNAGPDLYYTPKQVDVHLKAAADAFYDRPLIYFFNKFIFYKAKDYRNFVILGEIDAEIGLNHRETPWKKVNWAERRFNEAVDLNPQYLRYAPK